MSLRLKNGTFYDGAAARNIYLDTSAINFLFAEDAPDFRRATVDFFENDSGDFDLFISDVVLLEISRDPDETHRGRLLDALRKYSVKRLPGDRQEEVQRLAGIYLQRGVLPPSKPDDALHVAHATVYGLDILLSWNFKHLANVRREARFLAINLEEG